MRIPQSDKGIPLEVRAEIDSLFAKITTLLDPEKELRDLYLKLMQASYPEGIPTAIRVATNDYTGDGLIITIWQAHFLNEKGLLGREEHFSEGGYGSTNYSRSFSYRNLDVAGLYEFLADPQLPPPHD